MSHTPPVSDPPPRSAAALRQALGFSRIGALPLAGCLAGMLLLTASLGSQTLQAQIPKRVIATSAFRSTSVRAADLDGDGDPDVLASSVDEHRIAWYENQSGDAGADADGFGDRQTIMSPASGARSVHTADVDGDGDPDVLAATDEEITLHKNQIGDSGADADGFGNRQTIASDGAESVFAGDLDGDGDPDVLAATDDRITWYENRSGDSGAVDFGDQKTISLSLTNFYTSVYVADLNGDGDPDVLSAIGDRVSWYENQMGESGADADGFGSRQTITSSAEGAESVFVADLDGDGDPDVLAAAETGNKVVWHENQIGEVGADTDGFGSEQTITTNVDNPKAVFATDLDGDDDPDVLSASETDNKVAWYENQGGGSGADAVTFGAQQTLTTSMDDAASVFAADFDGDSDPDVVAAGHNVMIWFENTSSTLPVELASIDATRTEAGVVLTWHTASEQNNAGFEVQRRSGAGEDEHDSRWTEIGFVEGHGTTQTPQTYRFSDTDLPFAADTIRYRLRQVDADGSASVSPVVTVAQSAPNDLALRAPSPNPATTQVTVPLAVPNAARSSGTTLRLYNVLGQQVRSRTIGTTGRQTITLNTQDLSTGTYFLRLRSNQKTVTERISVVH